MMVVKRYELAAVIVSGLMLAACGTESAPETTVDTVAVDTTAVETSDGPASASTVAVEPATTVELATTTQSPTTSASSATTAAPTATPPAATEPTASACTNDPYVVMSIFQPHYDEAALVVQRRLVELGFAVGQVDGYFGSDSASALEAWGASVGFEGIPYNVDNNSIEGYVLEALGVACPAPKSGCVLDIDPEGPLEFSETARRVQQRLAELGYNPGDIDGYVGPNSEKAIVSWSNDGNKRTYYWGEGSAGFSLTEKGFDELGITCQ